MYDGSTIIVPYFGWRVCPFLEQCSILYVHPFDWTMAKSNVYNTQVYGDFRWLPSNYGYHLPSPAKVNKDMDYDCRYMVL